MGIYNDNYNPNNYIWLSIPGGIAGWLPEELNKYILEWNRIAVFVSGCNFFDYLSYKTGNRYYHFAWNNKNNNHIKIAAAGGK